MQAEGENTVDLKCAKETATEKTAKERLARVDVVENAVEEE